MENAFLKRSFFLFSLYMETGIIIAIISGLFIILIGISLALYFLITNEENDDDQAPIDLKHPDPSNPPNPDPLKPLKPPVKGKPGPPRDITFTYLKS
jgi:hypothetical protein